MSLSKLQLAAFEKARRLGAGSQGVSLSDGGLRAVLNLIAHDLSIDVPGLDPGPDEMDFFGCPPDEFSVSGPDPIELFESLVVKGPRDVDSYFAALAALHRARLKYQNILRLQPTPTLEQVGPRGLIQYGTLSPSALGSLLLLRKWLFDVDNRAAQETGYLFEPVIASSIGGVPVSARHSPVKRQGTGAGRQVDCLRRDWAYEIKLRVTIAASGQGRWAEELAFPADCRDSGLTPVLIVFDSTPNPKLDELLEHFISAGGHTYVGEDAWGHLEEEAGPTMALFLGKYVRAPIEELLVSTPEPDDLPPLLLELLPERVTISVGDEVFEVERLATDSELFE